MLPSRLQNIFQQLIWSLRSAIGNDLNDWIKRNTFKYVESEGDLYFDRTFMSLNLWGCAVDEVLSSVVVERPPPIRLWD